MTEVKDILFHDKQKDILWHVRDNITTTTKGKKRQIKIITGGTEI